MTRDQLKKLITETYYAARKEGWEESPTDFAIKVYIYPLLHALMDKGELDRYVEADQLRFSHHTWGGLVKLIEYRLMQLFDEWVEEDEDNRTDSFLSVIAYGAVCQLPEGGTEVVDLVFYLSGVDAQTYKLVDVFEGETA